MNQRMEQYSTYGLDKINKILPSRSPYTFTLFANIGKFPHRKWSFLGACPHEFVNRGYERIYIQSAWMIPDDEKMAQETFSLKHTGDSFKKVVIDGQPSTTYRDNDGICHISLIDFLLNPHSLETL